MGMDIVPSRMGLSGGREGPTPFWVWVKKSTAQFLSPGALLRVEIVYDWLSNLGPGVGGKIPISTDSSPHQPFFIIGSGRSGTTVLRAILNEFAAVGIPPESYVLPDVIRSFRKHRRMAWPDLVNLLVGKFEIHPEFKSWNMDSLEVKRRLNRCPPRDRSLQKIIDELYSAYLTAHHPNAVTWGDKTPYNTMRVEWLEHAFPDARYIHLVRDGRDVVASYLGAGLYESPVDAANRWQQSVERAKWLEERVETERFVELRYEDLVREPTTSMAPVCDLLDLEWQDDVLGYWREAEALGDVPRHEHHSSVQEPLFEGSIGAWKTRLSQSQQLEIRDLLEPSLSRLGYTGSEVA